MSDHSQFTPEGVLALAEVKKHMDAAAEAFSRLNAVENHACLDFHIKHASLNHCVRWGQQAAEDLLIEINAEDAYSNNVDGTSTDGEQPVRAVSDATLVAEINRRGMLQPLYGAIDAMHDHLDRTGALDEHLAQYLTYRLRREEAAITGMPDSAARVANWQECIDQLDREARAWGNLASQREVSNFIEQPINATIKAGVLTLPNGESIDLEKVQAALNFGFQETGDHDLMAACDEMSKLTGLVQGPSGEFVPSGNQQNAETPPTGPDPIKGIRVIVDVSFIDGAIPRTKLIGLLDGAVQERLMVKDLKCGGVVFGFSTDYRDVRSVLNDSPRIRPKAELLRAQLGVRANAQTEDSPVTTL